MVFKVMTNVMLNGVALNGSPAFSETVFYRSQPLFTMPLHDMAAEEAMSTDGVGIFTYHPSMSSILNPPRQENNPFADMGTFIGRRSEQPALAANGPSMVQLNGGHMLFLKGSDEEDDTPGAARSVEGPAANKVGGKGAGSDANFLEEEDHVLKMGGEQFKVEIYGESSYFEHPVRAGAFEALKRMVVEYEKRSGKKLVWNVPAGGMEEHLKDRLCEFAPMMGADAVYARFLLDGEKEAEMLETLAMAWFDAFMEAKWILEGTNGVKNIDKAIYVIATEVVGALVFNDDLKLVKESAAKMSRWLAVLLDWADTYNEAYRRGGKKTDHVDALEIAEAMAMGWVSPRSITGAAPLRWAKILDALGHWSLTTSATLARKAIDNDERALWHLIKRSKKDPNDVLSRELLKWFILHYPGLFAGAKASRLYDPKEQLLEITKNDSAFARMVIRELIVLCEYNITGDKHDVIGGAQGYNAGHREKFDLYFGLFKAIQAAYKDNERVMMPSFVKWLDGAYANLLMISAQKIGSKVPPNPPQMQ